MKTVPVPISELKQLYSFLEDLNAVLHSSNVRDPEFMHAFAVENYPTLRGLFYETVWQWLPAELQAEFLAR